MESTHLRQVTPLTIDKLKRPFNIPERFNAPRISEVLSLPLTSKKKIPDYSLVSTHRVPRAQVHRRNLSDTRHLPVFIREFVAAEPQLDKSAKPRKPLYESVPPRTPYRKPKVVPRPQALSPLPFEVAPHPGILYKPYTIAVSPKARITVYSYKPLYEEHSPVAPRLKKRKPEILVKRVAEPRMSRVEKHRPTTTQYPTAAATFGQMLERARIIYEEAVNS